MDRTTAIHIGLDLTVDDINTPVLCSLIPKRYRDAIQAGALEGGGGPVVNSLERRYLLMLRDQVTLAIELNR